MDWLSFCAGGIIGAGLMFGILLMWLGMPPVGKLGEEAEPAEPKQVAENVVVVVDFQEGHRHASKLRDSFRDRGARGGGLDRR
ncbi:MAG: hypothetical protein A3C90_02475 [Candidatus Magasanikbacteria bacterium RIFCSPHIGHO2_02_FULL_51_14]|uniref:Uncharacterized protein n=1 Tax=Candidatus Magasanikbacteria bacterium RIFCSPHIGHO2_02_FULL_51_14 TaxID=1798683 RepID=A0A1F6MDD9_9BACT|nr:MAG: hypothetical protein A3C90_02475 [Candidatus Magasanikbacteria bacterium RIFCSPHIGHO2_02_FULL_51_14]